jgi:hypothetical protein
MKTMKAKEKNLYPQLKIEKYMDKNQFLSPSNNNMNPLF